jgi:hypothetical protein
MKILMQGTNISNVGIRVSQQLAIGGASLQPNFSDQCLCRKLVETLL